MSSEQHLVTRRIVRSKTKTIAYDFGGSNEWVWHMMMMGDDIVDEVNTLKYLRSMVKKNGGFENVVRN